MAFEVRLSFYKTNSRNYERVMRLAPRFRQFTKATDPKATNELRVDAGELRVKWKDFDTIWEACKAWRGTSLWLNDTEISASEIRDRLKVLECCAGAHAAALPDKHCSPAGPGTNWNCRFFRSVSMALPTAPWEDNNYSYWYHFGAFDSPTVWRIDKPRIREALEREATAKSLDLCDIFSLDRIDQALSLLPDTIDIDKDKGWALVQQHVHEAGAVERKPIRVGPRHVVADSRPVTMGDMADVLASVGLGREDEGTKRRIPEVKFTDIGGIEPILQTVREVVELPLRHPEIFERLGIAPHRGILLHGPPGCGKTMIAKAIANEVKAHFIDVAGPEILTKWFGESEQRLRRLFDEASELEPSVIFFDEIDAIAHRRTGSDAAVHRESLVNQLLSLMDGVRTYGKVCVIASTNRPELIDEALLRPGRFDHKIEVPLPNAHGCRQILEVAMKRMPCDPDFDRDRFAQRLVGLSGADIAFIVREAAYNCLRGSIDVPSAIRGESPPMDLAAMVVTAEDFNVALQRLKRDRLT